MVLAEWKFNTYRTVLGFISAVTQKCVFAWCQGLTNSHTWAKEDTKWVCVNQLEMLKTFQPVCFGMIVSSVSDV